MPGCRLKAPNPRLILTGYALQEASQGTSLNVAVPFAVAMVVEPAALSADYTGAKGRRRVGKRLAPDELVEDDGTGAIILKWENPVAAGTPPVTTVGREGGGRCKHKVGCPYQVCQARFSYSCEFQPGESYYAWAPCVNQVGSARGLWSNPRRQKIRIQRQARGADQHKARDPGMDCSKAGEPLAMFVVSHPPGRWAGPGS